MAVKEAGYEQYAGQSAFNPIEIESDEDYLARLQRYNSYYGTYDTNGGQGDGKRTKIVLNYRIK